MGCLIALDIHSGNRFVDACQRIWADGDAVLPVDLGAPSVHIQSILSSLLPGVLEQSDGTRTPLEGGVEVEPGDALVIATSGTTGVPKGVVHTHQSMAAAASITGLATRTDRDSRWLACLPLSHIGGFSVITRALFNDGTVIVSDGFDPDTVTRAQRQGATHVSLVPTVLSRVDTIGWKLVLLGGSAIPPDLPSNCVATYGMTETFGGVVYDGHALEGIDLRVGADSIIEIRSPTLFRGYRSAHGNAASRCSSPTSPLSTDGYFRTGDVGSYDRSTGVLSVTGRADDLIITGGVKVWPDPVEQIINTHPLVQRCAVVGTPDPEWGQRVTAVIIPLREGEPPALSDIRDLVKAHLPKAAAPRELVLADSLPLTTSGKIRRRLIFPNDGDIDGQ